MNPAEDFWALEVAIRYLSMAWVNLVVIVENLDMVGSMNIVDRKSGPSMTVPGNCP